MGSGGMSALSKHQMQSPTSNAPGAQNHRLRYASGRHHTAYKPDAKSTCPATSMWPLVSTRNVTALNPIAASGLALRTVLSTASSSYGSQMAAVEIGYPCQKMK